MISAHDTIAFTVEVTGDLTNKKWFGKFAAKATLSHRDKLARDRLRREYLGEKAEDASAEARATAAIFSELGVRLMTTPEWWVAADNGLDLKDSNLVSEIFKGAMKIENDFIVELTKAADEAKKPLDAKAKELDAEPKTE